MYQAPYGIEVSGNVFGRQGYPFPLSGRARRRRSAATRRCTSWSRPQIDTFRYPNLWNTDLRVARDVQGQHRDASAAILDVFNLFNANTALVREQQRRVAERSTRSSQNLSPRIFRVGLVVGF